MQQEEEENNASIYNFNNSNKPNININISNTNNDLEASHISTTRYQKHTRQKKPILQIHGDALGVKHTDEVRILFENFNGLAAWKPRNDKILLARRLLHRLEVDCYAGTECNVQWNILKHNSQLKQLFKTEVETNAISACNVHESDSRLQQGGTGIITFDKMAVLFKKQGVDET